MAKKLNIKVDIKAEELRKKLNIKNGVDGKDGLDGKDAVVDTDKLALEASTIVVERLKPMIPTIEQVELDIPKLGQPIRDSLELLNGNERLSKEAISGLEDYDEVAKLAREPKVENHYSGSAGVRNFIELYDTPNTYSGQAGKFPKVNAGETGLEFDDVPTPTTPSLQEVTDVGASTTNTTTFSPSGNNKAIIANGSGSGIGIDITHTGSGTKLNIGAGGSGDAIRFDTDKFVVNDDGDISSSLFTASRALATNANKEIVTSATTATELGYLSGVTSAIQTQLNGKQASGTYVTGATNSTLTLTGTTLGLNLGNANTWTGTQTGLKTGLGATTTPAWIADNTTSATGAVLQASPSFLKRGRGFLSNTSASFPFEVQDYAIGKVNITAHGRWINQYRANNGTWTDFFTFDSEPGGLGFNFIPTAGSNSLPGTTRAFTINNAGSNTWIDFLFGGVSKSHIGADLGGALKFYAGGGSYFEYYQMSGSNLFSYNNPTAFYHSSNIQAQSYLMTGAGVGAGTGSGTTPTSTLQSAGSIALKVKRLTSSQSLDATATHWLLDATSANSCTGTPSNACATHADQTACEANDAHGGCIWTAGSSCDVYNGNQLDCQSTSGCTYDTASCSGFGDESTCTSYGGCSWSGTDCSGLGAGTCGSTSGCTENTSDCSAFNGSQSSCEAQSGCSVSSSNTCPSQYDESSCSSAGCYWDGMSCTGDNSTCSGSYFTGCSGTYYSCTGDYYTGTCSGTYGGGCTGTSTCTGIDDSTSCGSESGCTWSSVLNAILPDGETCPDRTYWLYNDSSGGADVVVLPYSGQTVNETTSYTLAAYRDWVHFAYFKKTESCSAYDADESTCNSTTGCSANYSGCTWNGSSCEGGGGCTSQGDEASCTSYSYFASCSGSYAVSKNWYKFGS